MLFEQSYLTLQLNQRIGAVLREWLCDPHWVVAEVAGISRSRTGHIYLDLVEKLDDQLLARARATIWSSRALLLADFTDQTGETLKDGMEVLLFVQVRYHEVYGLILDVLSLNPLYTLGGMARKRRAVIERLHVEGLISVNKGRTLAQAPMRVAVISSPTAAGYQDFVHQLETNPYGYRFVHRLFQTLVQGNEAELSLCEALREARARAAAFDVAVIIRGGGAQVDLSCFDSYDVAALIARFPIPVVTGIGHEKDDTVADLVAHTRAKTPTAAAEMLIDCARGFEDQLEDLHSRLAQAARAACGGRSARLDQVVFRLKLGVDRGVNGNRRRLDAIVRRVARRAGVELSAQAVRLDRAEIALRVRPAEHLLRCDSELRARSDRLRLRSAIRLERAEAEIRLADREVRALDPARVLSRGFSITRWSGAAIRRAADLPAGATIETEFYEGVVHSRVEAQEEQSEKAPR